MKRVEQLAVNAGLIASEYNGFDRTKLTKAEKKFAELIVQDCVGIIEQAAEHSPELYGVALDILDSFDMEIQDE